LSQLAIADDLPYVTHIATPRVRHSYCRHKVGHAQSATLI